MFGTFWAVPVPPVAPSRRNSVGVPPVGFRGPPSSLVPEVLTIPDKKSKYPEIFSFFETFWAVPAQPVAPSRRNSVGVPPVGFRGPPSSLVPEVLAIPDKKSKYPEIFSFFSRSGLSRPNQWPVRTEIRWTYPPWRDPPSNFGIRSPGNSVNSRQSKFPEN